MIHTSRKLDWLCGAAICLAASAVGPQAARAAVTYVETENDVTIIRMSVTPAAEPVPALKYRLVSRGLDLHSGNAAPYYYRAFLQIPNFMRSRRKDVKDEEELAKWYGTGLDATPIADLPLDKLRKAALPTDGIITSALRDAMSRRDCDWQLGIEDIRGPKLIEFVLDEFQQGREVSRMLLLQARLAIAERRYSDAIEATRMNYRLAIDTAKVPFLVCGLIGIAEAGHANSGIVDLIASPDSPNLYWALAELPQPLVDLRLAAQCEIEIGLRIFPLIDQAETTDHSPQEWNRLYTQLIRDLATIGSIGQITPNDLGAGVTATGAALIGYSHAKQQLIAQGLDRNKVEAMAVGQVMAIYEERVYHHFADEYTKLWNMPYNDMIHRANAVDEALRAADPLRGGENREVLPIAETLMPAIQAARAAQVRLDRDIAAIAVVESLRLYAASHAGGLPARLDEINEVPVPLNPATGQPFIYRLEGTMAVLELPASDGIPNYNRRFEITITQSK